MAGWKSVAWIVVLGTLLWAGFASAAETKVLVFTRQAKTVDGKPGFIHNNTAAAVAALQKLGKDNAFAVDATEDPAVFTDANLKQYQAIVFCNTNNQILDTESQQTALQNYVHNHGAIVGIHCATGSMRAWPWFAAMMGGRFQRHPKFQPFTIQVIDRAHPSTCFLGQTWKWEDEFYYHADLQADLHVLLAGDLATLNDAKKPSAPEKPAVPANTYPLAWCHEFEGARVWYTALGHKPEHYADPQFQKHLLGGLRWAMEKK